MTSSQSTGSSSSALDSADTPDRKPLERLMSWADDHWRTIFLSLIVLGIVLRFLGVVHIRIGVDGKRYEMMAMGFLEHGEFRMPFGNVYFSEQETEYSHHYPPLFPLYLAAWYSVFGFSPLVTEIASITLSLVALGAVFWASNSLYGQRVALFVTAALAVNPPLLNSTYRASSESLVLIFFTLTMWAIIRSLKDDRYMIYAGIFAGLGYLTKSSMGYFFIVAGICGFMWRFYYMRWKVFKNKHYMAAIGIFFGFVGTWAFRNILRHGSWETSNFVTFCSRQLFEYPLEWVYKTVIYIPHYLLTFFFIGIFVLPELKRTVKKIKVEEYSGLWLGVGLAFVIAWLLSGIMWMGEDYNNAGNWFPNRYTIIAFVPLFWLITREIDWKRARERILLLLVLLVALSLFTACRALGPASEDDRLQDRAIERLIPELEDGDIIAIGDDMHSRYYFAENLPRDKDITLRYWDDGCNATYVISKEQPTDGYDLFISVDGVDMVWSRI